MKAGEAIDGQKYLIREKTEWKEGVCNGLNFMGRVLFICFDDMGQRYARTLGQEEEIKIL